MVFKNQHVTEWEWKIIDSWWQFVLKQLDISEKFSYSHANFFTPEVSKILLQEMKWATFYPYNVPHNQLKLHFKNFHIWKKTREKLAFNLKLHIKLIQQGYCIYQNYYMKKGTIPHLIVWLLICSFHEWKEQRFQIKTIFLVYYFS